jgi:hypothetical protein
MDPFEIKLVRQYAINEIAGGLILGDFALQSENPFIRSRLTFHAMDELRHGWLWTEFLDKKGIGVTKAKGDNDYFDFMAQQKDEIMFLAAVHIYELRVPFHLSAHMELPQINPELKEVMRKIRDDEEFHLSWVRKYLDKQDPQCVLDAVKKCEVIEEETYQKYINHIKQYDGYLADLATLIEKKMPEFPKPSDAFILPIQNA